MSVFSVDPKSGNPVITEVLDEVCKSLGVRIKDEEKEDFRKLLAVFDESARELMAMDGKENNDPRRDSCVVLMGRIRLHTRSGPRTIPAKKCPTALKSGEYPRRLGLEMQYPGHEVQQRPPRRKDAGVEGHDQCEGRADAHGDRVREWICSQSGCCGHDKNPGSGRTHHWQSCV